MTQQHNTRQNLRGLHDRSELNRVRLRLYHARNRALRLEDETLANIGLLETLEQQERALMNG